MKFLFDLFPIILFFVAYKFSGIFAATATAIAATFVQIVWVWMRHRKVDTMLWVSLGLILVLGGATLALKNPVFIKWKPTVLYWLFAATLLTSELLFRKNLIRALMQKQLALPEAVWRNLNLSWAAFFILMGAANLYVAFHFSEDAWVNFKLFGLLGMMLAFVLAQGLMLAKYLEDKDS
jgi:intracellular septation protein